MSDEKKIQPPSLGRVVLFHDPGENEGPLAATIAWVWSDTCVNLTVHGKDGETYGRTSVTGPGTLPGQWSWPPFVAPKAAR